MLRLGIVGLPNVGKSTLFNALTSRQGAGGELPLRHHRAQHRHRAGAGPAARRARRDRAVRSGSCRRRSSSWTSPASSRARARAKGSATSSSPTSARWTRSCTWSAASRIRDIQHVMGPVDPVRDREVINIELGLADLATVEKRLDRTARAAKSGDPQARLELRLLEAVRTALAAGRPARAVVPTDEEARGVPVASTCSPPSRSSTRRTSPRIRSPRATPSSPRSAPRWSATRSRPRSSPSRPRSRPSSPSWPRKTAQDFLASLGLAESGLDRLAHAAYHLLGLQSYFTAGEKEVRAWTVHRGDKAPAAAGVIHSDFEKGFIRAETVAFEDFVRAGRVEGRPGTGARPGRGQGIRGAGRRRNAVPVQQLTRRGQRVYTSARQQLPSSAPHQGRGDQTKGRCHDPSVRGGLYLRQCARRDRHQRAPRALPRTDPAARRRAPPGVPLGQAHPRLSRSRSTRPATTSSPSSRPRPPRSPSSSAPSSSTTACSASWSSSNEGAQPVPVTAGKGEEEDDE